MSSSDGLTLALVILFVAMIVSLLVAAARVEIGKKRGAEATAAALPRPVPMNQAARELEKTPQSEQVQSTLDAAFHLATQQYQAGLETGQGGRMPTREQVAADLASVNEEHDRVAITTDELLAFAALAAGFERAFRPPIAADPDSDSSPRAW